jgi:hypothetical protein
MKELWRMMTRNAAGGKALLVAIMLGLSGGSAEAYTGPLWPPIVVTIAQRGQSGKVGCSVSQASPPAGTNEILVRIKVSQDRTPRTILLRTTFGETTLDVTNSLPLLGQYETIIDLAKTNCATSGTLLVDVEGDLETKTATCPGILLPKGLTCND